MSLLFQLKIIFSFFFFINCHKFNSYQFENVHFLISAKLNGTSPAISLKKLKPEHIYLYFLFDFDYHNTHLKKSKNCAYFKISTSLNIPTNEELAKNLISYRLSQKNWTSIKNNKVANNIMYKKTPILFKEEKDGLYNYYFKIEKKDDKKITLIIRVPTQGKREGFVNIYNILELPTFPKIRNLEYIDQKR